MDIADDAWAPKGGAPACCQDAANLTTVERTDALQVRQCGICGRKHYRGFAPMAGLFRMTDGR